ncbi:MAG: glycine--tRNA ligase subunit alpha, partial [Pseudomonadota bacterium]
LQARGVISVQERASYMGRVRDLARSSCEEYAKAMVPAWAETYPDWSLA